MADSRFALANIIGFDETLPITQHHDVYPFIDPNQYFSSQVFKNKAVLITGASSGLGQELALYYAKAGASIALVSRKQETLDKTKAAVLKEVPDAEVITFSADVKDPMKAEEAVKVAISRFGRLDVVITSASALTSFDKLLAANDAKEWWNTFEVNVRGVYNYIRAATPAILETKGSIVVVTSGAAQLRIPFSSDHSTSKFTLGRLVEFAALEYPELRVFALHPGVTKTPSAVETGMLQIDSSMSYDTVALPAATVLTISAGKAEWLCGRYWSCNWDLREGETSWKEKTLKQNGLVNKLCIPV